ncbi:MAG: hypothetical protein ACOZCO_00080 [Bacteroidota bacterium]
MNNKAKIFLAATVITCTLASCGGEEKDTTNKVKPEDTTTVEPVEDQVFYQIPTPNELFTVIKEIGGTGKKDLMNPIENTEKYLDAKFKALNFGIYSADLAYASCYDMGTLSLEYFKAVEKMGDELDISAAFDESVFKRIEDNLNSSDSLLSISNETYFDAYSYLEENERGNVLALVVAGGWVESMYIVMNLAGDYKDNNPIVARLADQKYTLDNILAFMYKYESDEHVKSVIAQLEEVQILYDALDLVQSDVQTSNNSDGQLVLSGGGELKFTKETYTDLFNKIKQFRTDIVNAKANS